jgi:hypothetical protein
MISMLLLSLLLASVCSALDSVELPLSGLDKMQPKTASLEYPNIVLIYADDLGYGDLSCYGATKINTPNIDWLAKEGRIFMDAHSTSAVCSPSR